MIEHCISSIRKSRKELSYKIYMSDMAKALVEIGTRGKYSPERFADWILPEKKKKKAEPKQEETAEAVIARITSGLQEIGQ